MSTPATTREVLDRIASQIRDLAKTPDHVLAWYFSDATSVSDDLRDLALQIGEHTEAVDA